MRWLFRAQPTDPWEDFDFALIEAYQTIQDEIRSKCASGLGCADPPATSFTSKVSKTTCQATRALEQYKDGKKKPKERANAEDRKDWGSSYYTEVGLLAQRLKPGPKCRHGKSITKRHRKSPFDGE